MKNIKTAEEILRESHEELSKPNPTDWKSFEEIMKDGTGDAMLKAMRAYAEQFIELAAEEAKLVNSEGETMLLCEYEVDKQSILKLKELLK